MQERNIKRINLDGMLVDLAVGTSSDAVVIARGIGRPDEQEQEWIDRFNKNGFTVAMPYYSGTWGSAGTFLIDSAKDDLRRVADLLTKGEFHHEDEHLIWKVEGITFIGLSFGGLASLVAGAQIDSVDQTVAIGTPIDSIPYSEGYKGRDPIKQAIFILKSGYGARYLGFTAERWEQALNGELDMYPTQHIHELVNKYVLLVHGADDEQTDVRRSDAFYEQLKAAGSTKVDYLRLENEGHRMTYSHEQIHDYVMNWIRKTREKAKSAAV
ncbi:MAG TPA: prolyl oligopeptidase family serine peptidase [Blastocatellia bacterium]|nr:prolyl oligopeptidase family serine peptidase [Blastocatellia bacterium]